MLMFTLSTSIDKLPPFISNTLWSSVSYILINRIVTPPFSYLRGCPRVNCWKLEKWRKVQILKGYKKRGEMSFSDGVMKHFITTFLRVCSSSDIINLTLCGSRTLWKKNCNTAVFKQARQTFAHSKHFVAKCLCMQIGDHFCFDESKRTSSVWRSAVVYIVFQFLTAL